MSDVMLLTEISILQLPMAQEGQYKVRDAEIRGFFVRVGKRKNPIWYKTSISGMAVASFLLRRKSVNSERFLRGTPGLKPKSF